MNEDPQCVERPDDLVVRPNTAPDFYRLLQKAVLLALKEQGVLDEDQLLDCLDRLGLEGNSS